VRHSRAWPSAPDLVDARSGTIRRSPAIGLTDFPLGRVLRGELQCLTRDIQVDNDANLAALAEFRRGSAAGVSDLVYLTGSTGIGGGIISEGRLFRRADQIIANPTAVPLAQETTGRIKIDEFETAS
jgi:predicted NBD/HSP70 family sugar kinase